MKIKSFTVNNYRSIVKANRINLHDMNVLIGKNNEGKSNILKALSVCMECIHDYRRFSFNVRNSSVRRYYNNDSYDWNTDFPVNLKNKNIKKNSIFELELSFDVEELNGFNRILHTRIKNDNITLRIEIGSDNFPNITFPTRGTNSLTKKKDAVLNFLSDKFSYNYIQAIRTEKQAISLIKNNIAIELKQLENNDEYRESLKKIREIQNDRLEAIATEIKKELQEFLKKISEVKIQIEDDYRYDSSINSINVYVDDGVLTNIECKGDGMKSLAVLAMLKNRKNIQGTSSIIAIDEPEAHIHPGAITELNRNLLSLSENNVVIVSTHNQGFINFSKIENNIIVDGGEAKPAKSVEEIRKVLGIRACDNLISARYVLLVEGDTDVKVLENILPKHSLKIKRALNERLLVIQSLGSASKLEYNLSRINNEMCRCVVLCDNDSSGRASIMNAVKSGLIDSKFTYSFICDDMPDSELEDCINPEIYKQKLYDLYQVSLDNPKFKNNLKWSKRIKACFASSSRLICDDDMKKIKILVANSVVESLNRNDILIEHKCSTIFNLISGIEKIL